MAEKINTRDLNTDNKDKSDLDIKDVKDIRDDKSNKDKSIKCILCETYDKIGRRVKYIKSRKNYFTRIDIKFPMHIGNVPQWRFDSSIGDLISSKFPVTTNNKLLTSGHSNKLVTGGHSNKLVTGERSNKLTSNEPNRSNNDFYNIWCCDKCMFSLIKDGKLTNETVSKTCYKCNDGFKSFKKINERVIIQLNTTYNKDHGKFIGVSYTYDDGRFCRYKLDCKDQELIESSALNFWTSLSTEQLKYYAIKLSLDKCIDYNVLWICYPCLYQVEFPTEIKMFLHGDIKGIEYRSQNKLEQDKIKHGELNLPTCPSSNSSVYHNSSLTISQYSNLPLCAPKIPMTEYPKLPMTEYPNLPICLCLIIESYLTPPYLTYKCKICKKDIYDYDDHPYVVMPIGFVSSKTFDKYFRDYRKRKDINKEMDNKKELFKPSDSWGFICYSCFTFIIFSTY